MTLKLAGHTPTFKNPSKNPKNTPKSAKTQKNTKIVRMTSYSRYGMSKKLAVQKYKFLIFGTNEGDFEGIPVKNL